MESINKVCGRSDCIITSPHEHYIGLRKAFVTPSLCRECGAVIGMESEGVATLTEAHFCLSPRVWITNYAGHDYTAAKGYGEFKFITKGYVSFQSLDRLKYVIAESMKDTRKNDWLLLSGRPLISCIASVLWLVKHKQVKILHWDQKAKRTPEYRELIMTLDNTEEILANL